MHKKYLFNFGIYLLLEYIYIYINLFNFGENLGEFRKCDEYLVNILDKILSLHLFSLQKKISSV